MLSRTPRDTRTKTAGKAPTWLMIVALVAMLTMLLAACGEADDDLAGNGAGSAPTPTVPVTPATPTTQPSTPTPDSTPDATPGTGVIEHPTGADDLVLLIRQEGGFVMPQYYLTNLPVLAIYGDGTVIFQGAQIMIYPPPALPPVMAGKISEGGLQRILRAAEDVGLLDGDAQYTSMMVADAHTTYFTVNAGGSTNEVSVYALELDELPADTPEEEREAREKLRAFYGQVVNWFAFLSEDEILDEGQTYEFDRLQVVSTPADPNVPTDVEPNEIEWPLMTPLAEFGEAYTMPEWRCAVVEGEDLETLLPILREDATEITRWTSEGEEYMLYLRPLLPHEDGCENRP